MELNQQWCDNLKCPDYGKINNGNIAVQSYVVRRYYCKTCHHTFSEDKGTAFEHLRSSHSRVAEVLTQLCERNSIRAIERQHNCSANTVLKWLDLAGAHASAFNNYMIKDLHLTQVQIDELWTFVKKNKSI